MMMPIGFAALYVVCPTASILLLMFVHNNNSRILI